MNENSFPLHNYAGARALRQIAQKILLQPLIFLVLTNKNFYGIIFVEKKGSVVNDLQD